MKDYQRLRCDERSRILLTWNLHREIAKLNYRFHTDAIKDNLFLPDLTQAQIMYKYASEADMLNVAVFGMTAKQWRENNPGKNGNIRDHADLNQLLVLANMESCNAILIEQGKPMSERLVLLREHAVKQLQTLAQVSLDNLPKLSGEDGNDEE